MINTKLDYRYAKKKEIKEKFSYKYLDSINDVDQQNIKTKSIIFAPFCSSFNKKQKQNLSTHFQNIVSFHLKNNTLKNLNSNNLTNNTYQNPDLVVDNNLIKFAKNVIDLNRNYEINNNGELDNGIFKKQKESTTDKKKSAKNSKKNSGCVTPNIEKVYTKELDDNVKQDTSNNILKLNNSFSLKIEDNIVHLVSFLGYRKEDIVKALKQNDCNYMTAAYYLLCS